LGANFLTCQPCFLAVGTIDSFKLAVPHDNAGGTVSLKIKKPGYVVVNEVWGGLSASSDQKLLKILVMKGVEPGTDGSAIAGSQS